MYIVIIVWKTFWTNSFVMQKFIGNVITCHCNDKLKKTPDEWLCYCVSFWLVAGLRNPKQKMIMNEQIRGK